MRTEAIHIHLNFLEPYRMVKWCDKDVRKKYPRTMRGQTFAQWKDEDDGGLPIITGTLVRSAVIKAAESLLSLNNGEWNTVKCCNGLFKTDKEEKPIFLRKRYTLQWKNGTSCTSDKCPYCILLGRLDNAHKNHKEKDYHKDRYDIHFSNFYMRDTDKKNSLRIEDVASLHTFNRVDFDTGKAKDYFKIWEVENKCFWHYTGTITLQDTRAKELLLASLGFVDKLCGALCKMEVVNMDKILSPVNDAERPYSPVQEGNSIVLLNKPTDVLKEWARGITRAFKKDDRLEKIRTLSDAVRSLRLQTSAIIESDNLPKGKKDGDKEHHLWDIKVKYLYINICILKTPENKDKCTKTCGQVLNKEPLRIILKKLWESNKEVINWREFTETLGNYLYSFYKEETGGISSRIRILGETEYYPEISGDEQRKVSDTFLSVTPPRNTIIKEWIVVGRLKAVTPFYFGVNNDLNSIRADGTVQGDGLKISDQTSFRILLNRDNKYRISRSVLRGALRRDLRIAFGSGCDVELGKQIPCICNVCNEMRKITLKDTVSDFSEPPEIRYRIEKNPYTATVEEGSLFDVEVGPEGITFRFTLRYRGHAFPNELASVVRYWEDGMAWLGGFSSIGKGRFSLTDTKVFEWTLNNQGLNSYIHERGLRGNEVNLTGRSLYPAGLTPCQLPERENLPSYRDNLKPLWTEIFYTGEVGSPLLTADTISALIESGNKDAIAYKKRVYIDETKAPAIQFAIKSETHRGIYRTAIGRRTKDLGMDDHEDCLCVMCKMFGNEHESSKIRFEDLVVSNENEFRPLQIHLDHVAIDRFNGGAVDKKKFDAYPLAGSPRKTLKLAGRFWIKKDISDVHKGWIAAALSDIRDGLYPLGSRGSVGYGWITRICTDAVPDDIRNKMRSAVPFTEQVLLEKKFLFPPVVVPKREAGSYYFPYIFLRPHTTVHRKPEVTGHEQFHENLISGKITCTLNTLTPLIIPNTDPAKVIDENGHKKFEFFSINAETLISGSEICGMTSNIYETLTNSCFRIFEEGRYISRRPKAGEEDIRPGIVKGENGNFLVREIKKIEDNAEGEEKELFRLPFYDDKDITDTIPLDVSDEKNEKRKIEIQEAIKWNKVISEVAEKNREFLNLLSKEERKDILSGRKEVRFQLEKGKNPNDHLACLVIDENMDDEIKTGYIKFTGLNMVQIKKNPVIKFKKEEYDHFPGEFFEKAECAGIVEKKGDSISIDLQKISEENRKELEDAFENIVKDDIYLLNTLHNTFSLRKSLNQKYLRPLLWFIKERVQYSIPKRCERIFLTPATDARVYKIHPEVRKRYNDVLEDYKKNLDHIEDKFLTITQNSELGDGDLVYFLPNDKEMTATAVFPVPLSRKADDKTLVQRLPYPDLRPCVKESKENIPAELTKYLDAKLLSLHPKGLCPACMLFGTTFYKGRVRFGFASLTGDAKWYKNTVTEAGGFLTLPLLERPRPTWPLPANDSKIPGRKFYLHHHGWQDKDIQGESKTKNNCSVQALDKGNQFSFEVYFENLHEWELGLLLYSLELEPELAHKLGKAKAFGFGSIRITVEDILRLEPDGRWVKSNHKKTDWLEKGFNEIEGWFSNSRHDILHIKNLRTILRFPGEDERILYRYPKLKRADKEILPGYVDLKKELPPKIRERLLTELDIPWYPYPHDKDIGIKDGNKNKDDNKIHDKKNYSKVKTIPFYKQSGIVRAIDLKGGLVYIKKKTDGKDIRGYLRSVNDIKRLAVGKFVQFTINEKGIIPEAQNIEITE